MEDAALQFADAALQFADAVLGCARFLAGALCHAEGFTRALAYAVEPKHLPCLVAVIGHDAPPSLPTSRMVSSIAREAHAHAAPRAGHASAGRIDGLSAGTACAQVPTARA